MDIMSYIHKPMWNLSSYRIYGLKSVILNASSSFISFGLMTYTSMIIFIYMLGGKEVEEQDDMFILVAPQNAVGNCIIDVRNTKNSLLLASSKRVLWSFTAVVV